MSGSGYDGSIRIDTSVDSGGFNTGINKLMSGLKGLGAAIGIAFGVSAITNFLKQSAQVASDVQIMTNKFHAVFGSLSDDVKKNLDVIAYATNFAKDDLMGFAADIQTTFMGMQFPGQQAAGLSIKVVQLAQDLATFNGLPTAQVISAIQSGMMGYTRELRQFGVVVDENAIKAKAQAMGIWDGAGAMNAQIKAQAILQILTDNTSFAQGNAAKTANTWAGEERGLAAAWNEFKEAVGSAITVFAPVIGMIKQAIQWLTVLVTEFAQFVSVLFGVDVDTSQAAANIAAAAGAAGDLTDNTNAAGKAAKGALASFDQINVLQQSASTAAAPSTGGGIGSIAPYVPDTSALDAIKEKVQKFKDELMALLQPAMIAFDNLKTAVSGLGQTVWSGLKWAWDNILVPLGKWTITNLLPLFLNLLATAINILNAVLLALKPLGIWLWTNFLEPMAKWTGGIIVLVLTWLVGVLKDIGKWITDNPAKFQNIAIIIGVLAAALWLAATAADAMAAGITLSSIAEGIATPITAAFSTVMAFLTAPITLIILAIAALVIGIIMLIKYWPQVSAFAKKCWDDIVAIWGKVSAWFNATVIEPIKSAFDSALTWISNAWQTVWTGITDFIKGQINNIIFIVNGMVSGIIAGINIVIGALDSIHVHIPSILGAPAYDFGINIPKIKYSPIPYLASGAVIPANSQFLAVLGDQAHGPNIEAPAELIRSIVHDEIGNMQTTTTINFAGNMAQLVRALKPYIDKENVRVGTSLIKNKGSVVLP